MKQNRNNNRANDSENYINNIHELFNRMDDILILGQLPYYDFLYMGLDELKKMSVHEQDLLKHIKLNLFKTEFEPEPAQRSFFKMLETKLSSNGSVLLLSVALPYPRQTTGVNNSKGVIEGSSWYYDYHTILRARMNQVLVMFSKIACDTVKESGCFVDTSDYIDRELAFLCGLGNYGKNQMLIHPDLGTQFHIGHLYIVLDNRVDHLLSKMESETELNCRRLYKGCQNCEKCVKACPAQICGTIRMNRLKCISYLTQTKKKLTFKEMKMIRNKLYGCDICQNVCPANLLQNKGGVNPLNIDHWQLKDFEGIELLETLNLSQRAFKRQYGDRGFAWRGVKVFKRNALIAMGNSGDRIFYEKLQAFSEFKDDDFLKPYYEYALRETKSD